MVSLAIRTKYLGATTYKGSRVKAMAGDKSIIVAYKSSLEPEQVHEYAARAYIRKFWGGDCEGMDLAVGVTDTGYVFVPIMGEDCIVRGQWVNDQGNWHEKVSESDQPLKCRECTIDFVQFKALLDKITRAGFGGWEAAAEFFEDDYDSMVSWLGVNPRDLDDRQEVILRRAMIMRGENLARDLALLTAYEEYTTLLDDEREEISDKILGPTGYWGACA